MENKGDIDAGYNLIPPSSLFGPFFTFSPSSGVLQPGALQSIQVIPHTPYNGIAVHNYHCMPLYIHVYKGCVQHLWLTILTRMCMCHFASLQENNKRYCKTHADIIPIHNTGRVQRGLPVGRGWLSCPTLSQNHVRP